MEIQCFIIIQPDRLLHHRLCYFAQVIIAIHRIILQKPWYIVFINFDDTYIHCIQVHCFKRKYQSAAVRKNISFTLNFYRRHFILKIHIGGKAFIQYIAPGIFYSAIDIYCVITVQFSVRKNLYLTAINGIRNIRLIADRNQSRKILSNSNWIAKLHRCVLLGFICSHHI